MSPTSPLRALARRLRTVVGMAPPAPTSNVEYNRKLWDGYAKSWSKSTVEIENPDVTKEGADSYLRYIGDEWGRVADVEQIVGEFIAPFVTGTSVVAEIGSGGGRVAAKVAPTVGKLHCLDISPA